MVVSELHSPLACVVGCSDPEEEVDVVVVSEVVGCSDPEVDTDVVVSEVAPVG